MAHTGKTGCKLICVCSEADETVFFCTSPPPPLPPQFSYMKCHKQHKPWDKRVLCLQRQSWGWEDQNCGVEYFPPAFPCDPEPDTLLFYSSVPVPVFSACFHFVGEMCMWGGGVFEEYHELCKGEKFCRWSSQVSLHSLPWTPPKVEFLTT